MGALSFSAGVSGRHSARFRARNPNTVTRLVQQSFAAGVAKLQASMTPEQWGMLLSYGGMLVQAAEQAGLTNELLQTGKAKLDWVMGQLQVYAESLGLHDLPVAQLEQLVEAKVYETLNGPKAIAVAAAKAARELTPSVPLDAGFDGPVMSSTATLRA